MKVICVGGGPAGLYFAILMKQRDKTHDTTVFERDPVGLTYGWGVVFWDDLLANLYDHDPETARAIRHGSFRWEDQVVHVQGKQATHLGGSGFSISRQHLLAILTKRAMDLGVNIRFEREIEGVSQFDDADLVVACDGANSRLRLLHADQFKTKVQLSRNKYIWLGTSKVFHAFTFPFVETDAGWIWFHGYAFNGDTSTCVVECSPETWTGLGFDRLGMDESMTLLQKIFEKHLDGHSLMNRVRDGNRTPWLNFRTVTNRRWYHQNLVLMGDAAHTTHFTIGSGTRLAMEDAIGLAAKLHEYDDIQRALEAYARGRQAALLLPQRDARHSARWFESIPRYIDLEAPQFATLLNLRFSRLLPHVSPRGYYALYQVAKKFAVLPRRHMRPSTRGQELSRF